MKRIICICIILLLIGGCSPNKKINVNNTNINNYETIDRSFTYEDFVLLVKNFKESFKENEFEIISNNSSILNKDICTFPSGLKLENRTNDGINGDISKPSKYMLYYLTKDKSVLVKVNFIYSHMNESGIILQSIISPDDNVDIAEGYKTLDRPFTITKLLSRGSYLIQLEYLLLVPKEIKKDINEKIKDLINVDINFYKQLEIHILELDKKYKLIP